MREFCGRYAAPEFVAGLAHADGPAHLDEELTMVQDTFGRFADAKLAPIAERIYREDADIPEKIIRQLAEIGAFGMSIPKEYRGFATGRESDYIGMVVATEELSHGSLATASR